MVARRMFFRGPVRASPRSCDQGRPRSPARSSPSMPGAASRLRARNAVRSIAGAPMVEERGEPFLLPLLARRSVRAPAPVTHFPGPAPRRVLCWFTFPLVTALRSTGSAAGIPALFVGFVATMANETSRGRESSATAPRLPDADQCGMPPRWSTARSPGSRTRSVYTCQGL